MKEAARGERILMWPAEFLQDVRYGLRTLAKNPGFTIVAVAALALGIGANSAIFSVVNSVLLRPLPFKDPNQLVMVWDEQTHLGFPKDTPTPANFLDWQRQNSVFAGMAAMAQRSFNLTGNGEPERLDGRRISANLFDLLGIQPQLGRNFRPEEDTPGTRVVILSHGLWERRFGADPRTIGRAINLNGESYIVVGVMPAAMELPRMMTDWREQLWVPLAFPLKEAAARSSHYLEVIARMKPGVTLQQAQTEMSTDRRPARTAISGRQHAGRRRCDAVARRICRRDPPGSVSPARRRCVRAPYRLCQRRQFAPGPGRRATEGNRPSARTRRDPLPSRPAISHRKPAPRRRGLCSGVVSRDPRTRRPKKVHPRHDRPRAGDRDRRKGARFYRLRRSRSPGWFLASPPWRRLPGSISTRI